MIKFRGVRLRRVSICAVLAVTMVAWAAAGAGRSLENKLVPGPRKLPTAQFTPSPPQYWNFDKDRTGVKPPAWKVAETSGIGLPAQWRVVADPTAPSKPNVVAITENRNVDHTYNLLLADGLFYKDLVIKGKVKADSGKLARGGGLVWRAQDGDNYYAARWDPLAKNLRVYAVKNGKRKMLASVPADVNPKAWHEIRVEMEGNRILASMDGKIFVETEDGDLTLPRAGTVGLWTRADAASSFDDITVAPLPSGETPTGPTPK